MDIDVGMLSTIDRILVPKISLARIILVKEINESISVKLWIIFSSIARLTIQTSECTVFFVGIEGGHI